MAVGSQAHLASARFPVASGAAVPWPGDHRCVFSAATGLWGCEHHNGEGSQIIRR